MNLLLTLCLLLSLIVYNTREASALVKAGLNVLGTGLNVKMKTSSIGTALPGDTATFTAWHGLRAYSTAQLTGLVNAIRIRRASDNVELDIKILTNGNFDVATAAAHCAATTCFVRTMYDQAGLNCAGAACNIAQATAANQPEFVFNCIGSKPCMRSANSSAILIQSFAFTPATGNASLYMVGGQTVGTTITCNLMWTNGTGGQHINSAQPALFGYELYGGTSGPGATIKAGEAALVPRAIVGVVNGALSTLNVSGVATTTAVPIVGNVAAGQIGGYRGNTAITCIYLEMGFADNGIFTQVQQNVLITSAQNYWGL